LLLALVPIALLAIAFEQRGGAAAASAAVAALGGWSVVHNVELSVLAFVSRVSAFVLVGLLVGFLVERLQWIRETQRRLFESSLDPLIAINISGDVTSVNPRALGLFGRNREEMVDHAVEEFLPGFFAALSARPLHVDGPSLLYRLSGHDKLGSGVPLNVSVIPWESEEGALLLSLRSESTGSAGRGSLPEPAGVLQTTR
jgi:PAS domain S-box-containing protein